MRNRNNTVSVKAVFKAFVARELMKRGFTLVRVEINKNFPLDNVYFIKKEEGLIENFDEIIKNRKKYEVR